MFQTQRERCGRSLRSLRTRDVRRLRLFSVGDANRMFCRLRGRAGARVASPAITPRQERTNRPGQRVLLLPHCGAIGRRGCSRLVHAAVAVLDLLHRRMRAGSGCGGILVWAGGEEAESAVRQRRDSRRIRECLTEILTRNFWCKDLSGRIGFPLFTHLKRPASTLPNGGGPVRP